MDIKHVYITTHKMAYWSGRSVTPGDISNEKRDPDHQRVTTAADNQRVTTAAHQWLTYS